MVSVILDNEVNYIAAFGLPPHATIGIAATVYSCGNSMFKGVLTGV